MWLAALYITGAYIKKYGVPASYSNFKNLLGYFLCVLLVWLSKLGIEALTSLVLHSPREGVLLTGYTSPVVVMSAVFLLLFFSNLKFGNAMKNIIGFFAPAAFGVYLLHEEPLIREAFIKNAFAGYSALNPLLMGLAVIGAALGIWLAGSLADRVRILIFELLKIKKLSAWLEGRVVSAVDRVCKK